MAIKSQEIKYLKKRKRKATIEKLCFYVCRVFPIKKNLISVCTFEGKGGFGCNAKPLVKKIHETKPECEFVWFVNDRNKEFPDYIRKVPNSLWSRAYWLSRSKVWIDNYRKPLGTCKRKGQYYLNVNHYTIGIKCTGLLRGEGFSEMAYLVSKNDSDMIDNLVIDSNWCEQCFDKALVYEGTFLKTGAPRCDVLYGERTRMKEQFRIKYGLPDDAKVVMFAPTFREDAKNGVRSVYSEIWTIDFKRLIHNLEKKFGGQWYVCVRVHPQLAPTFSEYKNSKIQDRLIDESQADDMYEILAAMDAYITDYSSACFEAGFAHIPVFIYADDIQKYAKDRGALMWNISSDPRYDVRNNKKFTPMLNIQFPFSIASNNEQLQQNILEFNQNEYNKKLDVFCGKVGLVFDGNASGKIADVIAKYI
ncbi:MAG: CDP-glycerol glycerophosphotransferase family protein [Lachnospiraceae bacterium]|nr:CDP-glycerol glycerophosphotransferase family protein [Lachnospiraceae bacterium]